jgi:hypothetical protein
MPADTSNTATNACGNDMTPLYSSGIPKQLACHERACKHPILGIFEPRLPPPIQEHLGQCGIKRDACIGVFGFDIAYMPNPPAFEQSDKAWYSPSNDVVGMPARGLFHSSEEYYATEFHELAHSTGHAKRLHRENFDNVVSFGSESYSKRNSSRR